MKTPRAAAAAASAVVLPLALAQFISSYAASNMNVAISAISHDLHTDVSGIQTAITLFTLTMAALMIPGSKLTDVFGRRPCFLVGLGLYGVGAVIAGLAPGLGVLIVGNSILEGIGSALMIPPVYILVTVVFDDLSSRAKYFGIVSGAGGLGAATGPLIGGLIVSYTSWRISFVVQAVVIVVIIFLGRRRISEPPRIGGRTTLDIGGTILSAAGLFVLVLGFLLSSDYGWFSSRKDFTIGGAVVIPAGGVSPVWLFIALGLLILAAFFGYTWWRERRRREPLVHLRLFRNRTANLGLVTQIVQWLSLQGTFFVVSVFLQQVRRYDAIKTGLALTPAIVGVLVSSAAAGRMARRRTQRTLIVGGFVTAAAGMALLLGLVRQHNNIALSWPGLLLLGAGIGVMLTASVNVVQSSFADADQGDISGVSRSASNLGSSLGTALAGSVIVAASHPGGKPFALALTVLLVVTVLGLGVSWLLPRDAGRPAAADVSRG